MLTFCVHLRQAYHIGDADNMVEAYVCVLFSTRLSFFAKTLAVNDTRCYIVGYSKTNSLTMER